MLTRSLLRSIIAGCLSILAFLSVTPTPPAIALGGPQPLLGSPAPPFSLPTNAGDQEISLSNYRGKWVVLYFYPKDFTAGCTLEARRFQQDLPEYTARNTQIIGVSADSVESHTEFCDAESLSFPLLSDPEGEVSKTYGSWLGFFSLRHTFIISPNGILKESFLGVQPAIHSLEVLERLDELQNEEAEAQLSPEIGRDT